MLETGIADEVREKEKEKENRMDQGLRRRWWPKSLLLFFRFSSFWPTDLFETREWVFKKGSQRD